VELDADEEAKAVGGATPLHVAAVSGHVAAMRMLVELGADIDAPCRECTSA
jgi:ankyrin repeat protein